MRRRVNTFLTVRVRGNEHSEINHNNHYILFCHVSFATMFLDWGRLLSMDAVCARWWRRWRGRDEPKDATVTTVPYWQLLSMQVGWRAAACWGLGLV